MFLVLGLGNPGPQYHFTRHNIGFLAADFIAEKHGLSLKQHDCRALYGAGKVNGIPVLLAKPMTYMNESGLAAKALLSKFNIPLEKLVVLHDEIDLPFGKIKLKQSGGDAGQKGVRSIIQRLAENRFTRIRLGVGRPPHRDDIVDYVLSPFEDGETDTLNEVMEQAALKLESALKELDQPINKTEESSGC